MIDQLVECAVQSLQHARSQSCRSLLAVAVAIAMTTLPAFAQATPPIAAPQAGAPASKLDEKSLAQRAAYDAAFQETLDKPSDPAVLVKFAKIAVTLGDVEGAISALERLLLVEGDQPEVKLELGVLYYRLGAGDVARAYLEQARDSELATDDVRQRANTYLSTGAKQ